VCIKNNLGSEAPALAFRLIQAEGESVAHVDWLPGEIDIDPATCCGGPKRADRVGRSRKSSKRRKP
jgi:hypothetical protein